MRKFSALQRGKNYLGNSLGQEKLDSLALLLLMPRLITITFFSFLLFFSYHYWNQIYSFWQLPFATVKVKVQKGACKNLADYYGEQPKYGTASRYISSPLNFSSLLENHKPLKLLANLSFLNYKNN